MSPSGKARDFDSRTRRFKSGHPSQNKGHPLGCPLFWLGWHLCVRAFRSKCVGAHSPLKPSGCSHTSGWACESRSEAELPAMFYHSNNPYTNFNHFHAKSPIYFRIT